MGLITVVSCYTNSFLYLLYFKVKHLSIQVLSCLSVFSTHPAPNSNLMVLWLYASWPIKPQPCLLQTPLLLLQHHRQVQVQLYFPQSSQSLCSNLIKKKRGLCDVNRHRFSVIRNLLFFSFFPFDFNIGKCCFLFLYQSFLEKESL